MEAWMARSNSESVSLDCGSDTTAGVSTTRGVWAWGLALRQNGQLGLPSSHWILFRSASRRAFLSSYSFFLSSNERCLVLRNPFGDELRDLRPSVGVGPSF
jgi:hypothetical protein